MGKLRSKKKKRKLKVFPSNAGELIEVEDIDEAAGTKSGELFLGFLENSLQGFRASCPIRKQPCRHSIPIEPIRHQCTPDKRGEGRVPKACEDHREK